MKKSKTIFRIAIVFNQKREVKGDMPEDMYAEFDDIEVPNAIKEVMNDDGYSVDILEADKFVFEKLRKGGYDFVFNIAEGVVGESRESHIPAMLEILGIPYSGSGILTQAIALDKKRTKEILLYHGLPTPKYQLFNLPNEKLDSNLGYPLIVKPNAEGSSKGIKDSSLVNSNDELKKMIEFIIGNYKQKALAEEYLPGREFTVALLGNPEKVYRMPILEIFVDRYPDSCGVYTYNNKYVAEDDSFSGIADIPVELKKRIYDIAVSSFKVLECRDMARVDIRCDKSGNPSIIEVNPLPGLHPKVEHVSYFTKACRLGGLDYGDMIRSILYFSFQRNGLLGAMKKDGVEYLLGKLNKIDREVM